MEETYLEHHGILGQRWGVRRYQNEDGSLTSAGKNRYDTSESQSNKASSEEKRNSKIKEYMSEGLTKEDAETAYEKEQKAKKILAVTAGIAVASLATYAVVKYGKENVDTVIKAGKTIQNISIDSNKGVSKAFFASDNLLDNVEYGFYSQQLKNKHKVSDTFKTAYEVTKDIKIASPKNGTKILNDKFQNDSSFRNIVEDVVDNANTFNLGMPYANTIKKAEKEVKSGKIGKNTYEILNAKLASHRTVSDEVRNNAIYDALKNAGYGGLKDTHDMKYSDYHTINPEIIFDGANSVKKMSSTKTKDAELYAGAGLLFGKAFAKHWGKLGLGIAGLSSSITLANQKSDREIVSEYRKEHPNTKLKYEEILENY